MVPKSQENTSPMEGSPSSSMGAVICEHIPLGTQQGADIGSNLGVNLSPVGSPIEPILVVNGPQVSPPLEPVSVPNGPPANLPLEVRLTAIASHQVAHFGIDLAQHFSTPNFLPQTRVSEVNPIAMPILAPGVVELKNPPSPLHQLDLESGGEGSFQLLPPIPF